MRLILLLFFACCLHAHSIVFVHLGPLLPNHLPVAIAQARLFNKECPIYLISNGAAFGKFESELRLHGVIQVPAESLQQSAAHQRFNRLARHEKKSAGGYWFHTVERFFYLEELIKAKNLTDVFHLENDVMIYVNLEEMLPIFRKNYQGKIGATFELDYRCCPGFFYVSNHEPIAHLMNLFADRAPLAETDMDMIGLFKKYQRSWIEHLPTVPPEYKNDHPLGIGALASIEPDSYSRNFEEFESVFDAAALGVYLGGVDPYFHLDARPGVDVWTSVFKPSFFTFVWELDSEKRKIPFLVYQGRKTKINNLHITCKKLQEFYSRSP